MHPGRCAQVVVGGAVIGFVGELHPQWRQSYDIAQAPMLFELDLNAVLQRSVPQLKQVPKLQSVQRDIAVVVVDAVTHAQLMQAIWQAPTAGLLKDAKLFDVYRPKNTIAEAQTVASERSLAVRLTLQSEDRTLTEDEIENSVKVVLDQLLTTLCARQRA